MKKMAVRITKGLLPPLIGQLTQQVTQANFLHMMTMAIYNLALLSMKKMAVRITKALTRQPPQLPILEPQQGYQYQPPTQPLLLWMP